MSWTAWPEPVQQIQGTTTTTSSSSSSQTSAECLLSASDLAGREAIFEFLWEKLQ